MTFYEQMAEFNAACRALKAAVWAEVTESILNPILRWLTKHLPK